MHDLPFVVPTPRACCPAAPFAHDVTLDKLTDFFSSVAPVNCVRMRRHLASKDFRGSIFIEFDSEETAKQVRALCLPIARARDLNGLFPNQYQHRQLGGTLPSILLMASRHASPGGVEI
jgi:hypothetical protein